MKQIDLKLFKWLKQNMNVKYYHLSMSGMPKPDFKELGLEVSFKEYLESDIKGEEVFRKTVAKKYSVKEENVLPTIGASEAIFLGISAMLSEKVYLNIPEYEPFYRVAEVLAKETVLTDLQLAGEVDYENSAIAFSNPNNPTGALIFPPNLDRYREVFIDETFMDFTGRQPALRLKDNTAIAGTMSKFYGLSMTRAGWIIARGEFMDRLIEMQNLTTNGDPGFMLYVAAMILKSEDAIRRRNNKTITENRKLVEEFLEQNYLDCRLTDGIPFCFPEFHLPYTSDQLCRMAIEKAGVLLIPGSFFGKEKHFRLCFTTDSETLSHGLDALSAFLKELREAA